MDNRGNTTTVQDTFPETQNRSLKLMSSTCYWGFLATFTITMFKSEDTNNTSHKL